MSVQHAYAQAVFKSLTTNLANHANLSAVIYSVRGTTCQTQYVQVAPQET